VLHSIGLLLTKFGLAELFREVFNTANEYYMTGEKT